MTNFEYIIQSKEHVVDLMQRLTSRYGICDVFKSNVDCPDIEGCEQGNIAWLDGDYDEYFWEE